MSTHHRTRQRTTEGNVFNLQQQPSVPLASPSPHTRRPARPVSWKLIPPTDTSLIRVAAPWILKRNCKIMKPFLNHAMNTSCHFLPLSLAVAGQAHISIPPAMSFISSSATLRLRPSSDPCSLPPQLPPPRAPSYARSPKNRPQATDSKTPHVIAHHS